MIGTSLAYLLKQVNALTVPPQPKTKSAGSAKSAPEEGLVVFPAGTPAGTLLFPPEKITMVLVNIEEERAQRNLDQYSHRPIRGKPSQLLKRMPDIRLSLQVLFVASFVDYVTAWNQLSEVISGFQGHPVFSSEHNTDFPATMEMITTELISQSLKEQRELWATLGTSQLPAVLYRFRLLTLRAREETRAGRVESIKTNYIHQ